MTKEKFVELEPVDIKKAAGGSSSCRSYWIDPDRCACCGACGAVCPCMAIYDRGVCYTIDSSSCACCGMCVSSCPADAIHAG